MSRRSREWNEGLSRDLRDPEFAGEFLLALLEEGMSLQEALGQTIRAYGQKEFSRKAKMPSSNISRVINPHYNPSLRSLLKLLKPFRLKLTATPITGDHRAVVSN